MDDAARRRKRTPVATSSCRAAVKAPHLPKEGRYGAPGPGHQPMVSGEGDEVRLSGITFESERHMAKVGW